MAKKNSQKPKDSEKLSFIQECIDNKQISISEVKELASINYPLFSFRYLKDTSIKDCNDHKFFYNFLIRLQKLSELGWNEIRSSHRHSYGMESLPQSQIIPDVRLLPKFVTPEVDLHVFRSSGDNKTFVGLQRGKIFYVFFIESKHGDICPH
ncbi:MAG: hypothetical protein HDS67_01975 [Bacteroidales bacterium]|nr:hypothetical protein [Bacteroidales bacterium]